MGLLQKCRAPVLGNGDPSISVLLLSCAPVPWIKVTASAQIASELNAVKKTRLLHQLQAEGPAVLRSKTGTLLLARTHLSLGLWPLSMTLGRLCTVYKYQDEHEGESQTTEML